MSDGKVNAKNNKMKVRNLNWTMNDGNVNTKARKVSAKNNEERRATTRTMEGEPSTGRYQQRSPRRRNAVWYLRNDLPCWTANRCGGVSALGTPQAASSSGPASAAAV
eukprot:TRINITY_DN51082_c0_g1_i1.p2 TRINITY_DN51082_c0_g1~~TRINITY_DN51082_c0_g1_i1.p2  ORF type:complete len:108 (-),score=21.91 TRINITY_DN51082_c0_g1_i1:1312-1635(-)